MIISPASSERKPIFKNEVAKLTTIERAAKMPTPAIFLMFSFFIYSFPFPKIKKLTEHNSARKREATIRFYQRQEPKICNLFFHPD